MQSTKCLIGLWFTDPQEDEPDTSGGTNKGGRGDDKAPPPAEG